MDRRLVGKWLNKESGDILNIFDETPYRLKMSCPSSGHYNFEPNCIYEKDGFFCYELNDEEHREIYRLKYEDGCLVGHYTRFGSDTPVRLILSSETPEDGKYRHLPSEIYLPSGEKRIDVLRKYAAYDREKQTRPYGTEYVLGGKTPQILEKYNYSQYIEGIGPADDAIAFRLLDFVCDHFRHNGFIGLPDQRGVEGIVAFCEEHQSTTNCRGLAILLATLLRLNGIRARHITCMPYEEPFQDCHVVVDCLLPSGKRIMLDPTYRLYLKDGDGEYVSLGRLREMFIRDEPFFTNEAASYNGGGFNREYHRNYMAKNTFRFSRGIFYGDGSEESDRRRVELIPAGYPVEGFSKKDQKRFVYNDIEFWKM